MNQNLRIFLCILKGFFNSEIIESVDNNVITVKHFYNILNKKIQLNSIITCPECGFSKEEIMPTDSCLVFYECSNCGQILKPKKGDCCVFCSFRRKYIIANKQTFI